MTGTSMLNLKAEARKVLAVTGIRSDYDLMSSVYRELNKRERIDFRLIVTGAHLSKLYGETVKNVEADGFRVEEKIETLLNADTISSRVKGLGIQLQGLSQAVRRISPDVLLVLGDREEAMSVALIGAYMNIPVVHVGGGDRVIGNVDDQVRHAVSRLAHIHLVTSYESEERIRRFGEQEFRIFNVGNPGLDRLINTPDLSMREISEEIGLEIKEGERFLMVIQHVISTEVSEARQQMIATMEAVRESGYKAIVIYPNSDAGGQEIIKVINEYKHLKDIVVAKNLERSLFVNLMRRCSCLIGNSSAGIMEAPLLRLPVINVGNRQKGRLHAENVIWVNHDKDKILDALHRSLSDLQFLKSLENCANPYGDGNSAKKIADIIESLEISQELLIKDITY